MGFLCNAVVLMFQRNTETDVGKRSLSVRKIYKQINSDMKIYAPYPKQFYFACSLHSSSCRFILCFTDTFFASNFFLLWDLNIYWCCEHIDSAFNNSISPWAPDKRKYRHQAEFLRRLTRLCLEGLIQVTEVLIVSIKTEDLIFILNCMFKVIFLWETLETFHFSPFDLREIIEISSVIFLSRGYQSERVTLMRGSNIFCDILL